MTTRLSTGPVAFLQAVAVLLLLGHFHITKLGQSVRQTGVVQARNIKQVGINLMPLPFLGHFHNRKLAESVHGICVMQARGIKTGQHHCNTTVAVWL